MKPARIRWLLLSMLVLLGLGGCVNLKQEIWLYPDGSGKMMVDMGVSSAFLEVVNSGPAAGHDPFQAIKEQYEGSLDPQVRNLSSRQYTDKDMQHYQVSFEVADLPKYLEQSAYSSRGMNVATLTRLSNGNLVFTQTLNLGGQDFSSAGLDGSSANASQVESMFKDHYWTVVLHAAGVVSADSSASIQDGSMVVWNIPIASLLTSQVPVRLTAEVKPGGSLLGSGSQLIFPAVLLAVFVSAILFLLLRRRPPVEDESLHPYAPYPPASHRDPED